MTTRDLAIDLGSTNTRVYRQGEGIVFDEPSIVAVSRRGEVLALGHQAEDLISQGHPDVSAAHPVARGVITEYELAQRMFRAIFRAIGALHRFFKPRVLVSVASSLTPVERRAVQEAATSAGSRSVSLVEDALAAALGAGLPVQEPVGSMVVDVGGGTAEMAMIALGDVILSRFLPMGGADLDEAIQRHVRRRYGIAIGERSAEKVKVRLGSAYPAADARAVEVAGREVNTGMPNTVVLSPDEIREVLSDLVGAIVETTRACLSESPPELAHDVLETGVFLAGGGAMLRGLDMRLAQECEVPVHLTEDPLRTVAIGAGSLLDSLSEIEAARVGHRRH